MGLLNGRERWNVDGNGNRSILISQGGVEGGIVRVSLYCTIQVQDALLPEFLVQSLIS